MAKSPRWIRDAQRWAARVPAPVELGAGAVLLFLPIPEVALELATDIAGVAMIWHGLTRLGRGRR
jgi:hypothetical protein